MTCLATRLACPAKGHDQLQPRVDLAESGYIGSFDPSTVTAYRASYSDFDNDPSTPFSASNASNIGRAGDRRL